jgi:hypothetical protein
MPPFTTIQHLAALQHAQRIQTADRRLRLFRQPLTARPSGTTHVTASVVVMPFPRHSAASAVMVA